MSLSWYKRKTRLSSLISADGGEDAEGSLLDQLMHGQTVIGKTGEYLTSWGARIGLNHTLES